MTPRDAWDRVYGDFLMPSRLGLYGKFVESALQADYQVVSVEEFWRLIEDGSVDSTRRYLILRHDVDTDPGTARSIWQMECALGVKASYYFRMVTKDIDLMASIGGAGGHASYHYEDLATVAKRRHLVRRDDVLESIPEAQELFTRNLTHLRERTGLPMRVVASHGDFVNRKLRIPNWAIVADRRFRQDAGIDLEVYDDAFMRHVTSRHADTGHPVYWVPEDPRIALDQGEPVVYVLTHPRHWRVNRGVNWRDDVERIAEGIRYALPVKHPPRHPVLNDPTGPLSVRGSRHQSGVVSADHGLGQVAPSATGVIRATSPAEQAVLLVRAPRGYAEERRYVLDVVLADWLGLRYELAFGDERRVGIRLADSSDDRELKVPDLLFATPERDWLTERSMPVGPLNRVRSIEMAPWRRDATTTTASVEPLPVLFGVSGASDKPWTESPTGLDLTVDVFGCVFFVLTRYEEVVRRIRDEHERFPGYVSLQTSEGILERPVVDEYVDLLWAAIESMWPSMKRRATRFRLRLTHDVDQPWAAVGQPVSLVIRSLGADLFERSDPLLAAKRAWSLLAARTGTQGPDPFDTFDFLMNTSERYGLKSTFYFLAGSVGGTLDGRYSLADPPIGRLLKRIHDRGHEVGLHASYGSYQNPDQTRLEFETLKATCHRLGIDQQAWGVRQHFLRFENPQTWRNHTAAGIDHDSTLGFADQMGFRAGTCREYALFDLENRQPLRLRERPLIVMDATLLGYMGLGLDEAIVRASAVVAACRKHAGDAVICYHNSTLPGSRERAHYRDLVQCLVNAG